MNNVMDCGKEMIRYGIGYGATSALTSWLAHSITKVGLLHGFGFGAVAGAVTILAYPIINKYLTESKPLALGLSITAGGVAGLAASTATAALGFAAAPITLSGAALCTGVLLVICVGQLTISLIGLKYANKLIEKNKKDLEELAVKQ